MKILFRGTMLRHSLTAYRDDIPGASPLLQFAADGWLDYVPIRLPETIRLQERLPPGAAAVPIHKGHTDRDLFLPIDEEQRRWFGAVDGQSTIGEILGGVAARGGRSRHHARARSFFERLWCYDQVVFDASRHRGEAGDSPV